MPLDPRTEADLLDWIGAEENGEDMEAMYLLRGSVEAAALSILKRRRANLGPDAWGLPGDYHQTKHTSKVEWLDSQIRRLSALLDTSPDWIEVGRVVRSQPGR